MNTLTKFIPTKFLNFFFVSFFIVLLYYSKVQNEENICKNLDNCYNYFFILSSYENSSFCFLVIKINVKVSDNN